MMVVGVRQRKWRNKRKNTGNQKRMNECAINEMKKLATEQNEAGKLEGNWHDNRRAFGRKYNGLGGNRP